MASESDGPPHSTNNEVSHEAAGSQDHQIESSTPLQQASSASSSKDEIPELPSLIKPQEQLSNYAAVPRAPSPISISNSITNSRESSPSRIPRASASITSSHSRQSSQSRSPSKSGAPSSETTPTSSTATESISNMTSPTEKQNNMQMQSWNPPTPTRRAVTPELPPQSNTSSSNTSTPRQSTTAADSSDNQSPERTPKAIDSHVRERSSPRQVARAASASITAPPGSGLETVQEMASDLSTPPDNNTVTSEDSRTQGFDEDSSQAGGAASSKQNAESGSESAGDLNGKGLEMKEQPRRQTSGTGTKAAGGILPKRSTTSLSGARGKPADGSARNMIVETETVSSIPQVSLATVTGDRGASGWTEPGTLRMKPSTETIRPKREKKRTRKPNAAASSKADIFEAKVANAVDEADVSDSDETFVYESNPPDPYPTRQHRYHSRTPSTTSMASQADQYVGRSRAGIRDGHNVTGKRSMKFTNNSYNGIGDSDTGADGERTPGQLPHIGRYGRGGIYPSLFDSDSPFDQAEPPPRSPRHFPGIRRDRHGGPRTVPSYRTIAGLKRTGDMYGYDYDAEGADDERTPLMIPRPTRSRHGRRPNGASLRQMEQQHMQQRQGGFLFRYGLCLIISFILLLLIGGSTSFIIAVTKPLLDLEVTAVQNVLASEQEIMLDLNVQAANPNLFPVAVDDLDVNIFARSRFVGTDSFWRERLSSGVRQLAPRLSKKQRRADMAVDSGCVRSNDSSVACQTEDFRASGGGVDHGTDPMQPSDPVRDSQTMLLGRVFLFDSPVVFEPSPWHNAVSSSTGQIRLARPGNKTEEGGTERWERVLQHPFELIVRGVVKYQLALSSRVYSSPISSSVKITPDDEDHSKNGRRSPNDGNKTVVFAEKIGSEVNGSLIVRKFYA